MRIEKIIENKEEKFDLWSSQLSEHLELRYSDKNIDEAERKRIFYQTNELLLELSECFFHYSKFKDNHDNTYCDTFPFGQCIILKSLKMNQRFDWGIEKDKFYLDFYVMYPENIKYMKDDFWKGFLRLEEYGDFKFIENGGISKEHRKKFKNKTSNVFRIIRNSILFQIDLENPENWQMSSEQELGWLRVEWDYKTKWSDLIEQSCKSFKELYFISYNLWKISDLKNKKNAR